MYDIYYFIGIFIAYIFEVIAIPFNLPREKSCKKSHLKCVKS